MEEINKNKFSVYIHVNNINGKIYVGQTCDIAERWKCDGKNYFSSVKFFRAIKKYGWNNFTHKVLLSNLTQEEADKYEGILITIFDSIKKGYNLKEGGARGSLSEESLSKMSISLKEGYKKYPERKEKIRAKALGRTISDSTKRKMSLSAPRSLLINVNGIVGCMKYWATTLKIPYYKLKRVRATDGDEGVRSFIIQLVNERNQ